MKITVLIYVIQSNRSNRTYRPVYLLIIYLPVSFYVSMCHICLCISPSCYCSVAKLYPTLWDPMDGSMPGFPVLHPLPEFLQSHVHWVGDSIQPSHPLSSPSPPAFNLSQHQGLFQAFCIMWANYWSFSICPSSEYSELISFRILYFDLLPTYLVIWSIYLCICIPYLLSICLSITYLACK